MTGSVILRVMAQENIDLLRGAYEAFNRGDFEAVLHLVHPDIEVQRPDSSPEERLVRGVDAFKELIVPDIFEQQHVEVEDAVEEGDRVLVQARLRVRTSGSGIELEERWFYVWTVRDGKGTRLEVYADRSEALEAAGLRE